MIKALNCSTLLLYKIALELFFGDFDIGVLGKVNNALNRQINMFRSQINQH